MSGDNNPTLPRMVMLTYQLPDVIKNCSRGEFDELDLNVFFLQKKKMTMLPYEDEVQKWLT